MTGSDIKGGPRGAPMAGGPLPVPPFAKRQPKKVPHIANSRAAVRENPIDRLKPKFQRDGAKYKSPLSDHARLVAARDTIGDMHTLVAGRYAYKKAKLRDTWKIRWHRRGNLQKEVASLERLKSNVASAKALSEKAVEAQEHYKALRKRPIPRDANERKAHFDELHRANSEATRLLKEARDAGTSVMIAMSVREHDLVTSRKIVSDTTYFKLGRRTREGVLKRWSAQNEMLKSFNATMAHEQTKDIETGLLQDAKRIEMLKRELEGVASAGGDLSEILGPATGPRLRTDVALQALRAAEPLSPHLRYALDNNAVAGPVEDLGSGTFNTVRKATLSFKDRNGVERTGAFALKPLDSNVGSVAYARQRGQSSKQTRAHARHAAAHAISKAMGFDLVDEPQLIMLDGKLHLAVPIADGAPPQDMQIKLRALARSPWKSHRQLANNVVNALHANPHLQDAMKDVQLFQAITGDPDGHRSNLHVQFFGADGKKVTHDQIIDMVRRGEAARVAALTVKVKLFDQDGAFPPMRTVAPVYTRLQRSEQSRLYVDGKEMSQIEVPVRSHNMGPPPYHTEDDRGRLLALQARLDEPELAKELEWRLIQKGHTYEIDALKLRVAGLLEEMVRQHRRGARLDDATGQSVGADGRPQGGPDMRQHFSSNAPTRLAFSTWREVEDAETKQKHRRRFFIHMPSSLAMKFYRIP